MKTLATALIAALVSADQLIDRYLFEVTEVPNEDLVILYGVHSHNDYKEQSPPLWHAVSLGIGSVEADIWLVNGTLFIGHAAPSNVSLS